MTENEYRDQLRFLQQRIAQSRGNIADLENEIARLIEQRPMYQSDLDRYLNKLSTLEAQREDTTL